MIDDRRSATGMDDPPPPEPLIELRQVQGQVAEFAVLDEQGGDPEVMHSQEDMLYIRVLKAVAAADPNAQQMAIEALKVSAMDFERWYA